MTEFLQDLFNEVTVLFGELSPYLLLGFFISGLLYIITSKEMIINHIGKPGYGSIIKASMMGVPMPLCSCGVIPVSSSLYRLGASKGATISFLISTPQTGVDSIAITYAILGPIFALLRPIISLITGIIGGLLVEKISPGDYISETTPDHQHKKKRLLDGFKYAFIELPQDIAIPLIKGIILAAIISMFIPENFFLDYNIKGFYSLILMAIAGIPMYICATASVPIAGALMLKGLDPGAALVFLMTGPATNIATITIILNTLGTRVVSIYLAVVGIASIIFGIFVNKIFAYYPHQLPIIGQELGHHHISSWMTMTCSIAMIMILGYTIMNRFILRMADSSDKLKQPSADLTLLIKGMTCNHCTSTVQEAIQSCEGVDDVNVDLDSGKAYISGGNIDKESIINKIINSGYSVSSQ